MGKSSQRKGADGERELASLLRTYGYEIHRGGSLSYGEVPDLMGLPGVHIEYRRAEQLRLAEWLEQAERDAERFQDDLPAIFHRRSRQGWLVTVRLEDFMRLYEGRIISESPPRWRRTWNNSGRIRRKGGSRNDKRFTRPGALFRL